MAQRARRSRLRTAQMSAGYAVAELEAALAVPEDRFAAGFFDVDNTMMQGASIYYLARGLAARKYFTTGDLLRFGVPPAPLPAARGRARRGHVAGPRGRARVRRGGRWTS